MTIDEESRRGGIKAYLSAREKHELLHFLAATGENYDRYLDYCAQRGWKPFSRKYLHTWIQRRRGKFQVAREEHKQEVRRLSMWDKQRRIEDLERSVEVINQHLVRETVEDHECTRCGMLHTVLSAAITIKLMEQKRKLLEAIAKERNEWLKEGVAKGGESARDRLRSSLAKAIAETKQTEIIDGRAVVVA